MKTEFSSVQTQLGHLKAKVGLVLGSGLGVLNSQLTQSTTVAYKDIPELGFDCSVKGHDGALTVGLFGKTPVACLSGRAHWYESPDPAIFMRLLGLLRALGCEQVILTNAAGAINPNYQVGDVVLLKDHINLQGLNPLVGLKPVPFISMENAYDADLRQIMQAHAATLGVTVPEGVYCGVLGPSFETPAEIKAFATMGGDVIGMSTVPEVIVARYLGLRVMALSIVTNMAAGISEVPLSHTLTLEGAKKGTDRAIQLLRQFLTDDTTN